MSTGRPIRAEVRQLEARSSAIAKLARHEAPAALDLTRMCGIQLEPWQVHLIQLGWPPVTTVGHALQRAAAENA